MMVACAIRRGAACGAVSGRGKEGHTTQHGGLAGLHFGEGFAHHLLGHTGAFAALGTHTEALAHIPIAAEPS